MLSESERRSLGAIADDAARAAYDSLWSEWRRAQTSLMNARLMGDLAGPELIAQREKDLSAAKQRMEEWERANPGWYPANWIQTRA